MRPWREPHAVGVRRRVRDPRDPVARLGHDARAVGALERDLGADRAAVGACNLALARGHGWHERVAVDLAVRMVDCRADFATAVLEHEHVFDLGPRQQRFRSSRPHVDHFAHVLLAERCERLVVLGREQHDLARADGRKIMVRFGDVEGRARAERRPAVREPPHVVRIGGFETADAERTTGIGKIRTSLAVAHDVDPLPREWIEAQLALRAVMPQYFAAWAFGHEIRVMNHADVKPAAAALARAFADDPLQVWAIPDEARRVPLLEACFAILIEHLDLPYGMSYCDAEATTAAIWLPPVLRKPSPSALKALSDLDTRLGDAGPRLHAAQDAMDAVRPAAAHYYLQGLGTDPPFQGRGLGSAVLQPMLAHCDAERVPAYLESTKDRNIAFYEKHGFVVTGTIDVKPDGPRLWTMWRAPA